MNGAKNAPSTPPSDTAPEMPVRDQSNSAVIGTMKMESVATAAVWRTTAGAHRAAHDDPAVEERQALGEGAGSSNGIECGGSRDGAEASTP